MLLGAQDYLYIIKRIRNLNNNNNNNGTKICLAHARNVRAPHKHKLWYHNRIVCFKFKASES